MSAITGIFAEKDGKISSMRVLSFIVVMSVIGVYIAHNVMAMLRGTPPIPIGLMEVALVTSVLGVKAVQHFSETKETASKKPVEKLPDNELPKDE